MSNVTQLATDLANHVPVSITYHTPEFTQENGTVWIESNSESKPFAHLLINEDEVFNHEFEPVSGSGYSVDELPKDLVLSAIEDLPQLVEAYEKRLARPSSHPVFFNRKK